MRVLIDANILLDVLQARRPHLKNSSLIWKLCETDQTTGYVSSLSFANIVYVMCKELDAETIEDVFAKLQLIFRFTELSVSDLSKAIALRLDDFEDALQIATASRLKADYIITRNVKNFIESETPVVTPDEYLTKTLGDLSESNS